jgi:hypothetical protein
MKKGTLPPHQPRLTWLEELEQRLLFSAGLEGVLAEESLWDASATAPAAVTQDIHEIHASTVSSGADTTAVVRRELLIFDTRVPAYSN